MEPPWVIEQRCLEYQYIKIGRQTYFGQWTLSSESRIDALNATTLNLADEPTLANGHPPGEFRIVALNTTTPNLADECSYLADKPSLANGPPSESRIDALNATTPNLADEPNLADGPPQ